MDTRKLRLALVAMLLIGMVPLVTARGGQEGGGQAAIDLEGYEFVIASHWIHEYFPQDYTPDAVTEIGDLLHARYDELEEAYNISIVPVTMGPGEVVEKVVTASLAGDKYADVIDLNWNWFQTLRAGDYLAPMDELDSIDVTDEKFYPTFTDFATVDGSVYGIWHRPPEVRGVMFFNKSLFEREGLTSPYELLEQDNWTWDTMLEIAQEATMDTDGDGQNDIFGITSINDTLEKPLIWSNGGRAIQHIDGEWAFTLGEPEAIEAMQFAYDIYNTHNVYSWSAAGTDWTQPAQDFAAGNIAMFPFEFWFAFAWGASMVDDFGVVPFPRGPQADDYVSHHGDVRVFSMLASNGDRETSGLIWNAITQPLPGTEPGDWKLDLRDETLRDDESLRWLEYILDGRMAIDRGAGVPGLDYLGAIFSATRSGENTPSAAMAAIEDQMQAAIDEFFGE